MKLKLITSLGAAPKQAIYEFDNDPRERAADKAGPGGSGAERATRFFPVALSRHIRPDTVCVLLTPRAKNDFWDTGVFTQELSRVTPTPHVDPIFIPDGRNEDELWEIFQRMADAVEPGEQVVFDITHGLRSFVFLAFLSIAYLRLTKNVTVRDVYYGALSIGGQQPVAQAGGEGEVTVCPAVRLTPFVSLLDWTEHVATFVRYGNAAPMAELARASAGNANRGQSRFANKLRHVSEALLTDQPRALGQAVQELMQARTSAVGIPPFALIMDKAVAEYQRFETAKYSLGAQMDLVRWYAEKGYAVQAAQLLRELFVNKIIVTVLDRSDLLYAPSRREVETVELRRRLKIKKEHIITDLWGALRNLRNTLAHCGFESGGPWPRDVPNRLNENIRKFEAVMDNDALWKDFWQLPAAEKKLLLTPLGTSLGLLLTALARVRPDAVVVVTSQRAAERIPEVVAKAGYKGEIKYIVVEDVFSGFREARRVRQDVNEAAREMLGDGGFDVIVNLTGGTTVLQYLVERAADHFRGEGCVVKRVVMVDRRPYEEQQKDPYVVGEMLEIDADTGTNGGEDEDME